MAITPTIRNRYVRAIAETFDKQKVNILLEFPKLGTIRVTGDLRMEFLGFLREHGAPTKMNEWLDQLRAVLKKSQYVETPAAPDADPTPEQE